MVDPEPHNPKGIQKISKTKNLEIAGVKVINVKNNNFMFEKKKSKF